MTSSMQVARDSKLDLVAVLAGQMDWDNLRWALRYLSLGNLVSSVCMVYTHFGEFWYVGRYRTRKNHRMMRSLSRVYRVLKIDGYLLGSVRESEKDFCSETDSVLALLVAVVVLVVKRWVVDGS